MESEPISSGLREINISAGLLLVSVTRNPPEGADCPRLSVPPISRSRPIEIWSVTLIPGVMTLVAMMLYRGELLKVLGATAAIVVSPTFNGWKLVVAVADPAGIITFDGETVPTLGFELVMFTATRRPPATGCESRNSPDGPITAEYNVIFAAPPVVTNIGLPSPYDPLITILDGASLTVPVQFAYPGARARYVTEPELPNPYT